MTAISLKETVKIATRCFNAFVNFQVFFKSKINKEIKIVILPKAKSLRHRIFIYAVQRSCECKWECTCARWYNWVARATMHSIIKLNESLSDVVKFKLTFFSMKEKEFHFFFTSVSCFVSSSMRWSLLQLTLSRGEREHERYEVILTSVAFLLQLSE